MIGDDVFQKIEPEKRKLRQDAALIGNGSGKYDIERGEPVGGDDEQFIAEIVDVADLSSRRGSEAGEMRFLNDAIHRTCSHGKGISPKAESILAQRFVEGKQQVEEIAGKF